MTKKTKVIVLAVGLLILIGACVSFLKKRNFAVLNPKGTIAQEQYDLFIITTLLMLIVVVPVLVMTFWFAYKYRASNKKARYSPNWDHNSLAEFTWWVVPSVIIVILSVITYKSTYALDPFRPIDSQKDPIKIQVVALDWKWLFIYPEQNIATVNYIQIPKDTPVNFEITADAPMNSFWVPQLGGQIYAMAGMSTKIHLEATELGTFDGSSANLSGEGFAGMKFEVRSSSEVDFYQWVTKVKLSPNKMTMNEYKKLAIPSKNNPVSFYSSAEDDLYDKVMRKFMEPGSTHHSSHSASTEYHQ